MADIIDRDLDKHPLLKDDLTSIRKFGLATANDAAPSGTVISNIYEPEDEYQNLYIGASRDQGIIQPPYYQRTLDRLSQENNALQPCIEAMVTNIDGTGYEYENSLKKADEAENDADDTNIDQLEDFFKEPWPGQSFLTIRALLRRDLERVGNAYLEVMRNPQDVIVFIRHVDAKMMRIVRLDDPVPVKKTMIRSGKPVMINVMTRERRYTQDVNGITLVYFKEFGASRDLNKNTGLWLQQGSRLAANMRGTEIIHMINLPDAHTPYGIPRWVNQLPSILGSRRAEEFNLEFFEHGGVPPVLVLLQGGALGKETKKALEAKTSQGSASKKNRVQVIEVEPNGGTWEQQSLTRVTVERFGSERTSDSMFEKYDDKCEVRVRRSFRLPPIFVGSAGDYNFATAFASYTVAEAQVFKPERRLFDEIVSMLLIPAMGFAGYAMKSNPLTIDDATLKLEGIQVAISTNVVNDAELLTEINTAVGTNMKADDQLVKLKSNQAMGLNPDGSKPPVQIPGVQGLPSTALRPISTQQATNPRSPKGPGNPKVGGPLKPPSQASGKGAPTPGKSAGTQGKVKKTAVELTRMAVAAMVAVNKRDVAALNMVLVEIRKLDEGQQDELRDLTMDLRAMTKTDLEGVGALSGPFDCHKALQAIEGPPRGYNGLLEGSATRLVKLNPNHDDKGRFASGDGVAENEKRLGIDHPPPKEVVVYNHFNVTVSLAMFHGTASQFVDSIKEKGLLAGHRGSGDDYDKAHGRLADKNFVEALKRAPSVYVSSDLTTAKHFAAETAANHPGSHPVIFEVDVPISKLGEFKRDEIGDGMAAVRIEQNIPKEWIGGLVQKTEETKKFYCVVLVDGKEPATKSADEPRDQDGKWTSASGSFLPVVQGAGKDKNFYVQHGPTKTWLGSTMMFKRKADAEAFVEKHLDPKNEWWRDAPNLMTNVYSKAVDEFHKLPPASKKNPLVKDGAPAGMLTRLFKGKGAGAPVFNGGQGGKEPMEPPGPDNTAPEFSDTTRASLAHDAASVDQTSEKMDRFVSAMSPSASRYGK